MQQNKRNIPNGNKRANEGGEGCREMSGVFQVWSKQIKIAIENKTNEWLDGLEEWVEKMRGSSDQLRASVIISILKDAHDLMVCRERVPHPPWTSLSIWEAMRQS